MVVEADTVGYPGTVVVHLEIALLANRTMVDTLRLGTVAVGAVTVDRHAPRLPPRVRLKESCPFLCVLESHQWQVRLGLLTVESAEYPGRTDAPRVAPEASEVVRLKEEEENVDKNAEQNFSPQASDLPAIASKFDLR